MNYLWEYFVSELVPVNLCAQQVPPRTNSRASHHDHDTHMPFDSSQQFLALLPKGWNAPSRNQPIPARTRIVTVTGKAKFYCSNSRCGNEWTSSVASVEFVLWRKGDGTQLTQWMQATEYGQQCKQCDGRVYEAPYWYEDERKRIVEVLLYKLENRRAAATTQVLRTSVTSHTHKNTVSRSMSRACPHLIWVAIVKLRRPSRLCIMWGVRRRKMFKEAQYQWQGHKWRGQGQQTTVRISTTLAHTPIHIHSSANKNSRSQSRCVAGSEPAHNCWPDTSSNTASYRWYTREHSRTSTEGGLSMVAVAVATGCCCICCLSFLVL